MHGSNLLDGLDTPSASGFVLGTDRERGLLGTSDDFRAEPLGVVRDRERNEEAGGLSRKASRSEKG